ARAKGLGVGTSLGRKAVLCPAKSRFCLRISPVSERFLPLENGHKNDACRGLVSGAGEPYFPVSLTADSRCFLVPLCHCRSAKRTTSVSSGPALAVEWLPTRSHVQAPTSSSSKQEDPGTIPKIQQ